jgi:coenzyme F420 hydrogenase subunit beta
MGSTIAEKNVGVIRDAGLCMGCGTCESVCPVDAIKMSKDERKGVYLPILNSERCTDCGLCLKVCPGAEVNTEQLADYFLNSDDKDEQIGRFKICYIGHASAKDVRYNSASGGLVTSLLIYALEKHLIDGALVLGTSEDKPLESKPLIATTTSELIKASGSKYCPAAVNRVLRRLLSEEGRFAVVGLPCHIYGLRKWEMINERLQEKIVLHLGLFCANNNTYLGTEYFLQQNRIRPKDIREIRYRAEGWPGKIRATLTDNTVRVIPRATTEKKWYRKALFASAFHYDFMIPRCLLCADQTSELADISVGDPWLTEYKQNDRIGSSLVIVRNEQGANLLSEAVTEGVVSLKVVDLSIVKRAQNYSFKATVGARIRLRRSLRLPVPDYSQRHLSFTARQILRSLRYTPSYFSYHRVLWPAIRALAIIDYIQQRTITKIKATIRFILKRLSLKKRPSG